MNHCYRRRLTFEQDNLGWAGFIRIDNQTYKWMGQDYALSHITTTTGLQVTPTRSIFSMQAGPMSITVTFLSPIEPSNWVLQSLPFSYVSLEAVAIDGQSHEVQLYSDISADWLSGDRSSLVRWGQHATNSSIYHEISLQSPQPFAEIKGQAQDGVAYYAIAERDGLSWQIDQNQLCRDRFGNNGTLANTVNTDFTPIQSSDGLPSSTAFAIAVDLGMLERTASPVTWSIGYVRNATILYTTASGSTQKLSPYFVTQFGSNIEEAIDAVTTSYPDVLQRAIAFDEAITMGALDFTVSTNSDGTTNASDVRIFMKDVNGDAQSSGDQNVHRRVNAVEKMYAALPALLYVNASIVGPLLAPLLDAQDGITTMPYAAQDLGVAYPNATGIHGPHDQGLEQSGNMLIMLYAHARFSGDGSLINAHYELAKRWADYLVAQSLTPTNQISADGEGSANMTNLAIKGIIGVKAMAEISRALGEDTDAQQYDSHAAELVNSWQSLAISADHKHLLGFYGDEPSWSLMYNIYADRLLGTEIVSQTLLQGETDFYRSLLQSSHPYGTPLDTVLSNLSSPAWQLFTAAIVQDDLVRDGFISQAWATANLSGNSPFSATYYTAAAFSLTDSRTIINETNLISDGSAGPAAGAMYALLALNLRNMAISVPNPDGRSGGGESAGRGETPDDANTVTSVGAIVGGVVGGIGGLILVSLCIFWFLRRWHRLRGKEKVTSIQKAGGLILSMSLYMYSSSNSLPSSHDVAATVPEDPAQGIIDPSTSLEPHRTQDSVPDGVSDEGLESDTIVEPRPPSAPTLQDAPATTSTIPSGVPLRVRSDPEREVRFISVKSFAAAIDLTVKVPEELRWRELRDTGKHDVKFDVAYGGAFYVIVQERELGFEGVRNGKDLKKLDAATATLKKLVGARKELFHGHGLESELEYLYGVIVVDEGEGKKGLGGLEDGRIGVCFFADQQIDRSPTGSGVSARVALARAKGLLGDDERVRFDSLLSADNTRTTGLAGGAAGSFVGSAVSGSRVQVEGRAYYTGACAFVVEDTFSRHGFLV
ncbi:hypothetical protein ACG7TL_004791 [Trametes sanguinea]